MTSPIRHKIGQPLVIAAARPIEAIDPATGAITPVADAERIATLVRKGWIVRPEPPPFDPATHAARWDGSQWIVEPLPPAPVPESVPAHHLRRALTAAGLRAQVEALIASLPEDHPMRDDWMHAPTFSRNAIGIEAVRQALSLTTEQVDDVFRVAARQST